MPPCGIRLRNNGTTSHLAASPNLAFESPPIWEIGISVGFPFPGWFKPYDVREVHDLFRGRFPAAERQPQFLGLQPFPPRNATIAPQIVQFGTAPDLNRWWFVNESGSSLVQVQENFLARNWRRLIPPPGEIEPYPGFDAIYGDFRGHVDLLKEWSARRDRPLPNPSICELLYEDLIPLIGPDGKSRRASEIVTPIKFDPPLFAGGLSLSWLEFVNPEDQEGHFTLHVSIQFVGIPDLATGAPLSFVKLSFVARSPCEDWAGAFAFIEAAHLRLGQRLIDLTTDEVRATWNPA